MAAASHCPLKIGEWRVDPPIDEISRDRATVKLEPRAMRVLVYLAERAGQVVSVEQLLDAVWKDAVVTPDSVYQAVASLRRALGDDTKEPAYIANVLRRGYRLIAPVGPWIAPPLIGSGPGRVVQSDPAAPPPMATSRWPMLHRPSRWGTLVVLMAGALLAGIVLMISVPVQPLSNSGLPVPATKTPCASCWACLRVPDRWRSCASDTSKRFTTSPCSRRKAGTHGASSMFACLKTHGRRLRRPLPGG